MNSSVIGKIEKARRYAQEKERIRFESLSLRFRGENSDHRVELTAGKWRCSCDFFTAGGWNACAHTMALERILEGMLPPEAISQRMQAAAPQ